MAIEKKNNLKNRLTINKNKVKKIRDSKKNVNKLNNMKNHKKWRRHEKKIPTKKPNTEPNTKPNVGKFDGELNINKLISENAYDYVKIFLDNKTIINKVDGVFDINLVIGVKGLDDIFKIVLENISHALMNCDNHKITVTIVEQDSEPHYHSLCKEMGLDYIFLPQHLCHIGGQYSTALMYNTGYLLTQNAKHYIFHCADILIYDDFFNKIVKYLDKDYIQTFSRWALRDVPTEVKDDIMKNNGKIVPEKIKFIPFKQKTNHAPGGSLMIKSELMDAVGGYDPELFYSHTFEDIFMNEKLKTITGIHMDNPTEGEIGMIHINSKYGRVNNPQYDIHKKRAFSFIKAPDNEKNTYISKKSAAFIKQKNLLFNYINRNKTKLYRFDNMDNTKYGYKLDDELSKLLDGKSVCVVGPSINIQGKKYGELIDSYDIVVRLGQIYEQPKETYEDYGSRTDIIAYSFNDLQKKEFMVNINKIPKAFILIPMVAAHEKASMNKFIENLRNNLGFKVHKPSDKTIENMWADIGTKANSGFLAIKLLLFYNIKKLFITGIDFYNMGKYGKVYRDDYLKNNCNKVMRIPNPSGNLSKSQLRGDNLHKQQEQIEHFRRLLRYYGDKIELDEFLTKNFING